MAKRLKDYLDIRTESLIWTEDGWPRQRRFIQDYKVIFKLLLGEVNATIADDELTLMGTYKNADFVLEPSSSNVVKIRIIKRK
jgi:hypothetical protein